MATDKSGAAKAGGYRWLLPSAHLANTEGHQLKILNSFTRKKELFVANEQKIIRWYSCGPTVYDVAHLGHARCYITFDILRRIFADYFGYQVFYVMNITDIDDKIIKRARCVHLYNKFIEQALGGVIGGKQLHDEIREALDNYQKRRAAETDPFKLDMINKIVKTSNEALNSLKQMISKGSISDGSNEDLIEIFKNLSEVIADEQDNKLAHTVQDHQIFKTLAMKYESEFHEDMQRLDVLPPNALTRVSQYIEETGLYLKQIESNGFAYRSNGSVYFDTEKFEADPKHSYAKLVREAFGQKKSLDEGEGELSVVQSDEKKSPNDFAMWKKSKTGEPSWMTQDYEAGRPGWHIECSVMASKLLGENFDIHSGGCDLKFPHHDNEIAQAEAYYNTGRNWVNYFIHSGHLSITGCKMSKSLKNFITIRQALQDYTSRQLRFAFLAHSWADTLDYSPNTMNTALIYEKTFREFFLNVTDTFRRRLNEISTISDREIVYDIFGKWSQEDHHLNQEFTKAINKVDVALCDNFDTRSAIDALTALVKECNKRNDSDLLLTRDITCYIERILRIFGAPFNEINLDKLNQIILPQRATSTSGGDQALNDSETILKYVDALAQFRAEIRRLSKDGEPQDCIKHILALCDKLRDQTLPNLGVRLEDKEGEIYVVKLVDAETLAKERASAEKREQEKRLKEETMRLEKLKLQQQREEKMKVPPNEMFRSQTDKYSKFDDNGMPTHDSSGKEVSKSALKKLQRLYAEQEARYKKYLEESK